MLFFANYNLWILYIPSLLFSWYHIEQVSIVYVNYLARMLLYPAVCCVDVCS